MSAILEAVAKFRAALDDFEAALLVGDAEPGAAAPSKSLTAQDLAAAAAALSVPVATVMAVRAVESGPLGGFAPDGRPIILFEPHVFSRLTNHRFDATQGGVSYPKWGEKPYPKGQDARWAQLTYAAGLDHDAAYQSASYGLFQIMGFNWKLCGFASLAEFVTAMQRSELDHLMAFVAYIKARGLASQLAGHDWLGFANGYNGPAQASAYADKLAAAFKGVAA